MRIKDKIDKGLYDQLSAQEVELAIHKSWIEDVSVFIDQDCVDKDVIITVIPFLDDEHLDILVNEEEDSEILMAILQQGRAKDQYVLAGHDDVHVRATVAQVTQDEELLDELWIDYTNIVKKSVLGRGRVKDLKVALQSDNPQLRDYAQFKVREMIIDGQLVNRKNGQSTMIVNKDNQELKDILVESPLTGRQMTILS